jgi:putative peptidoglycan lipid II flippase
MIGVSLVTVDEWLVRFFASERPGEIAQLGYARSLMMLLFAMLGQATGQAALPYLTRLFHGGQERPMGNLLARSAEQVGFFAAAAAGGLIAMAAPFTAAVYMRHRFTPQDALATSGLLVLFAVGLVGWSLQAVVVRGFYARKDTLTPMIIGVLVVFAAIPLYRCLYHLSGPRGLALASSLGITTNAAATLLVYRFRKGTLPLRPIFLGIARGLLFAGVGGFTAYGAGRLFGPAPFGLTVLNNLLRLGLMAAAYCLAGVPVALLVKPPELYELLGKVAKRLRR